MKRNNYGFLDYAFSHSQKSLSLGSNTFIDNSSKKSYLPIFGLYLRMVANNLFVTSRLLSEPKSSLLVLNIVLRKQLASGRGTQRK